MKLLDLERRLAALEETRRGVIPTAILCDRPHDPTGALPEPSLAAWQSWIADGIGGVHSGVLVIAGPEITADEWAARYVTAH